MGTLSLTNSTIGDNTAINGGGIFSETGALTMTGTTVRGNTSRYGGGINNQNGATLTVTNSTFSSNNGSQRGGGIYNGINATLTVTNSTFSGNSAATNGGGIYRNSGTVQLINTIISGNTASVSGTDCEGSLISLGHNLIGDTTDCGFVPATADQVNVNPLLGPLADNGGPTLTHALLAGSPAIDSGDDSVTGPPHNLSTDQRGQTRLQGLHVDIGAYEFGLPVSNTPPVADDQSVKTEPNIPVHITLTGDDTDPGDNLTFMIDSLPGSGDIVFSGDTVSYDPNAGFVGTDSFRFKVNDGAADSNVATVTITVACSSLAPKVAVGWTLVGWTCESPGDPAALAAELGGSVRIYGYDTAVPDNPWKIYNSAAPPFVNTLEALTKWNGYWVYYTSGAIEPPAGMGSWWPGDGNADDIVGNNHGVLQGGATYIGGLVGEAFSFDGAGDSVLVADNANLNITGDVTIDLWARRTVLGGGNRYMVFKGAGAIAGSDVPTVYALGFRSDNKLFGIFERANASNVDITGPTVADLLFHHYAYVRVGNTHKLFMDGLEVKSATFTGSPGDTSGLPLVIGAVREDPGGFIRYFGGIIDEVEVFNRALSAAEIKSIFDAGSAGKRKPASIQPPSGMVSWWPGDGNASDIWDGNHGTLLGGATFTGGMVGQAFRFDGSDDSVIVGHDTSLNLNHFTLEAWVKPGRLPANIYQAIITKNAFPNPRPPSLWLWGNKVEVWFDPVNRAARSTTGLTLDNWHHLVGTYDGSAVKIYIDGVLDVSAPQTATPATNTKPLRFGVGRDNDQFFHQGLIDEVTIYNRALTAGEVKEIYDAGSLGKAKP